MVENNQGPSIAQGNNELYDKIILIVDIILLHIKFWYQAIETIIRTFLPKEEANVNGVNVLITGTGHGIGKELALKYAKLGAKVICWDVNDQNNRQTVKEIKAAGGQAFNYTVDVTNRNAIKEVAEKIQQEHGFIAIVINNAGIMPCRPLLELKEQEIRSMFEINVIAHFWIIEAFLPAMKERNQGSIVALSSCAGLFGLPNLVPYCGTKFAVRGIMEALAEELRFYNPQNNIKLTTICPYIVDTGLCKNQRIRFPSLMKPVTPQDAAETIIKAQRTGEEIITIPSVFLYLDRAGRILPKNSVRTLNDFVNAGVDSDI